MSNLPKKFLETLMTINGFNEDSFMRSHEYPTPISVRINPFKKTEQCPSAGEAWNSEEKIQWCDNGKYLPERPSFTLDPLFHAGCYYVQEASSMFLEQALKQTCDLSADLKILDLCAAPGGKSTLISSLISENSMLVSNEVIKTRVNVLSENLIKWGTANTYVTNNDPADFARIPGFFDVIVIDAPCSGSGLFRKDPDAIKEWSEANVNLCSQRQQRILADVFPALKENGIIIYSTCSYSKQENEDVLDWMVEEFLVSSCELKVEEKWGVVETISDKHKMNGYRFYPDKVKGEGFFIAVMKKTTSENSIGKRKETLLSISKREIGMLEGWVSGVSNLFCFKNNESVYAIPNSHRDYYEDLSKNLYIKKAGICIGELMRNELIPDHQLAMSLMKNKNIPSIEIDKKTALNYLRKETISVKGNIGWNLINYEGHSLGWAKLMPNRMNNYYPKEWRILIK